MEDGQALVAEDDKIWLVVPFAERATVKAAGTRWDRKTKSWYYTADMDKLLFAQ